MQESEDTQNDPVVCICKKNNNSVLSAVGVFACISEFILLLVYTVFCNFQINNYVRVYFVRIFPMISNFTTNIKAICDTNIKVLFVCFLNQTGKAKGFRQTCNRGSGFK